MVDKLFAFILFLIGDQSCKAMKREGENFFSFFFAESLAEMEFARIFATLLTKSITRFLKSAVAGPLVGKKFGLVVQLVRIHACHAWGRGFESRPDRYC